MISLESPGLFLLIGGFFLSLLMAAGALASRNPAALRWIVAGLFASIALSLLPATAHLLGKPGHWLLGWVGSVASFFPGPFLFQYARLQCKIPPRPGWAMPNNVRPENRARFLWGLNSMPVRFHLIANGTLGLIFSSIDLRPFLATGPQDFPSDLWLSNPAAILGPIFLIVYMQWSARKLRPIRPGEAWILQAYCALLLLLVFGLLWFHWLGHSSAALICVLIFVHFVYLQRNPPLAAPERRQQSPWTETQAKQWMDRLSQAMTEERPYLDEDLSLSELAAMISLSTHQLSWLLNEFMGTNFYSYLSRFRIREACDLLSSEKERTILSIAYACGFNSKSSFHNAFKKELGMSPGAFRRSNLTQNLEESES